MDISKLPDKELKGIVIKILTELGSGMDEHSKNCNREIENISKYETIFITELKDKLEVV